MIAIVDARTGQIYNPPISDNDGDGHMPFLLPEVILPDVQTGAPWVADLEYRLNSRLMVVKAYDQTQQENYVHYFLWTNNRWTLLRRAPLAPSPNKPQSTTTNHLPAIPLTSANKSSSEVPQNN